MKKEPKKSNFSIKDNICENCAWTFGCSNRSNVSKYYCFYYDKYFEWEHETKKEKDFVMYLKMTACPHYHSIPLHPGFDMKRGAEFAKYFQNKWEIERSSTRSWISIIISAAAVLVSIAALVWKATK